MSAEVNTKNKLLYWTVCPEIYLILKVIHVKHSSLLFTIPDQIIAFTGFRLSYVCIHLKRQHLYFAKKVAWVSDFLEPEAFKQHYRPVVS